MSVRYWATTHQNKKLPRAVNMYMKLEGYVRRIVVDFTVRFRNSHLTVWKIMTYLGQEDCWTGRDIWNWNNQNARFFFYFFWVRLVRRPLTGLWHVRALDNSKYAASWRTDNWQGKPKYTKETCPSATYSTTNPTWLDLGWNPGCRGGKPASNGDRRVTDIT
jgi:hypothetical protein